MIIGHDWMRHLLLLEEVSSTWFHNSVLRCVYGSEPSCTQAICCNNNMDRIESLMDDMEDISDERASYPLGSAKRCQLEILHMRKRIRYIQAMIRASECSSAPQQGGLEGTSLNHHPLFVVPES